MKAAKRTVANPALALKRALRFAVSPRSRQSDFGEKHPLLQDFPGGRPAFLLSDGPLETPCWLWQGAKHRKGYASRCVNGRRVTVHRELIGPLAADEDAHHICGVRGCVNPDHIERLSRGEHARLHRGGPTALDASLELLAAYPRLTPAAISALSGHPRKAVCMALHRAHRSGLVLRLGAGEYVLAPAQEVRAVA